MSCEDNAFTKKKLGQEIITQCVECVIILCQWDVIMTKKIVSWLSRFEEI